MICKCEEDCTAVILICPFCRNISKTASSTLFVGTKRPCKKCRENDTTARCEEAEESEEAEAEEAEAEEAEADETT
jgi:hypothetical protein